MSALVSVDDVHVSYGEVAALRGISATVAEGEIVGVIGPNGAGKTTLVETISGFHDYTGNVGYRGQEVAGTSPSDLVAAGLVHCTESRDLFGYLSVEDNLELGAYRRRDDVAGRLEFVYDLFPTLADRSDQNARTMSGGEQQMLAIGRALMGDPDVLILDEPTLGLAPVILQDISAGLEAIRNSGVTILLAEQNVTFTMNHADRVYLLENGTIEREGDPEALQGDEYIRTAYLGE
ncbi:ABC transporter ATP-binding protein [Haladaptatus sp. W1]|uniref:ABC transporter ATP-binding protein n=1 Tax=Haladaptatus sp. W1 TaxID=1897478 RepID=UPI000849C3C7|nr:ABC transporter ATP-binding protein [Haladaptatus sp. W1]ODR79523.1 ABC transporter ATP-binding protein [Haladaptatus sp. W1]